MLDPAFTSALARLVPPAALLTSAEDTRPYECDGLTLYREQPGAVLLPDTEAQVVEILRLCHAARVPVVARGAGTSLSGGALPIAQGVRDWHAVQGGDAVETAVAGGDDYELLFTVRPSWRGRLRAVRTGVGDLPITRIGAVTRNREVVLSTSTGPRALPAGFDHFR